jgi:hypothetical protein
MLSLWRDRTARAMFKTSWRALNAASTCDCRPWRWDSRGGRPIALVPVNLAAFPEPPGQAGSIDLGPAIGRVV